MPDFGAHHWVKSKGPDDDVAQQIRSDVRRYRREHGRGGHRFRHATLKNLWYVDQTHAVLNHTDDPVWQYWYNHPINGWVLVDWFRTRREAQAAAERPHPPVASSGKHVVDGTYVFAWWPNQDVTMRVRVRSDDIGAQIIKAFEGIGCNAALEVTFARSSSTAS